MSHFYRRSHVALSPATTTSSETAPSTTVLAAPTRNKCACGGGKDGKPCQCATCKARRRRRRKSAKRSLAKRSLRRSAPESRSSTTTPGGHHRLAGLSLVDPGNRHRSAASRAAKSGPGLKPSRIATSPAAGPRALVRRKPLERRKKILGFNVNKSHCSCIKRLESERDWAVLMSKLYAKCGKDPKNKTSHDVEACHGAETKKLGLATSTAGSTSSTGKVTIKKSKGPCGPIVDHATKIHEAVHAKTTKQLQKLHGKKTAAFNKAWNDGPGWAADEVKAYGAEVPFYQAAINHLKTLCQKQPAAQGGGHTGAVVGGLLGALGGAIGGFFLGGPVGAILGGLLGAAGGAGLGSLFD